MFPNRNRPAAHQHRAQDPEDEYDQQRQIHRMPELALPDAPGPGWHEETFIEANERHQFSTDADSTLGDDVLSDTASLRSAALRFVEENGRRYHAPKTDSYFLPNDEVELERLDMIHLMLVERGFGKLHLAPIGPNPQRILDLGTGTGIWAMEMGDKYPSAYVIGNDISPVQPSSVPPNVFFEVDNIEEPWIYSAKFDYIHLRHLAGSIKDWPRLMQQAYDNLNPGAWFECAEVDVKFYTRNGQLPDNCAASAWADKLADGLRQIGMDPLPASQLEGWFRDAGFINIKNTLLPLPLGPWPKNEKLKRIGIFDATMFLEALEGISMRVFTHVLKWEVDEVRVFCAAVRKDLLNFKLHIQHDYRIVYGQKPY